MRAIACVTQPSPDGSDGSLTIHQDARIFAATLSDGKAITYNLPQGRYGWLQVARGTVDLNGQALRAGDGAAIEDEPAVTINGNGELLFFDLN